ncbi:hypothetical protein [Leptolyngbya sp. FACHB-8]|uniref:hypothetical protein n=1 Tax=unclassified Leptolyngbya TaxID=2650499 RepID=UPI0016883FB3|nr:hypothetical protein [Leptolyngbya sp. FACHB-8]MBD1912568.1 hypothetical protein [Leptolyngbya sp. FACHB-8]
MLIQPCFTWCCVVGLMVIATLGGCNNLAPASTPEDSQTNEVFHSQELEPVATPAEQHPTMERAQQFWQQQQYLACISDVKGTLRDRQVDWNTPEWNAYQELVQQAEQLLNQCWRGRAAQLAASGNYQEAILAIGRTCGWLGVNASVAHVEPAIQEWVTALNLTGEWWMCGFMGKPYLATAPDTTFVYSNACNGNDAHCFCQKIHN